VMKIADSAPPPPNIEGSGRERYGTFFALHDKS
jgi:hypothetical protein